MVKEKYIELCVKKLGLSREEAIKTVNYLEAMIQKVVKEEIEEYERQSH